MRKNDYVSIQRMHRSMRCSRFVVNSIFLLLIVIFSGCSESHNEESDSDSVQNVDNRIQSDEGISQHNNSLASVGEVENLLKNVMESPSLTNISDLQTKISNLKKELNNKGINNTQLKQIKNCIECADSCLSDLANSSNKISLIDVQDQLISEQTHYPFYLNKGEKIFYNIDSSSSLVTKLYNADTEKLIKTYKKNTISDSIVASNSGIYLIEITPKDKQYNSISLCFTPNGLSSIYSRPKIKSEQVACKKGDFGAKEIEGITMQKCFEEPRKITLRGQLKAAFSGNSKALVSINLPEGATDILYSMRISTSESSMNQDGKFYDNINICYNKVKFLGLPLYESSQGSGLFSMLLDDNRPIKDEDAYCNMYVFYSQTEAKKFQDGVNPSSLDYIVDYSQMGTQSCNGRIPVKGKSTIYLGFENERMRYSNYIWIEVIASTPKKEYHKLHYKLI